MSFLTNPIFVENGEFLIVMDNENRENEGDLIIAAEFIDTVKMAFLVRHSSGYICAPLLNKRADRLELPLMLSKDVQTDRHQTAYTITCDHKSTSTGISAADRAATCNYLADDASKATDFTKPGHIVPLRAVDGLIKARQGHTEAAIELCELAGLKDAAVICELVRDEDGLMKRLDDCVSFGKQFGIKIITIDALLKYVSQDA